MNTISSTAQLSQREKAQATSALSTCQNLALLAICGYLAFYYTCVWTVARHSPYAIEYEGHVLWACLRLAEGANIYTLSGLEQEPWSVIIYTPLYFVLGGGLLKLLGTSFETLRLISMTSALVAFLAMGVLLKRCRLNDFHSLLAITMFVATLPVLHWSSVARVDFLGLALAIWSMERFVCAWQNLERKEKAVKLNLLLSAILSVAAFFTKQQYFVFMVACAVFAYCHNRKKLAISYTLVWTGLSLLTSTLIQSITGGYWAHLAYATGLAWEWETLSLFLLPFLGDPKTIVALLAIFTSLILARFDPDSWTNRREQESEIQLQKRELQEQKLNQKHLEDPDNASQLTALPTILLVISLGLALYSMGLRGAFHNHLLCTEFALFWLAALCLKKLPKHFSTLMLVATAFSLQPLWGFGSDLVYRLNLRPDTDKTIALIKNLKPKSLLTEDPSLALFTKTQPAMVDATTILNLGSRHPQNLEKLLENIRQRTYGAVIINTHDALEHRGSIWKKSIVEAIHKNYRLAGKSGGNGMAQTLFLPR